MYAIGFDVGGTFVDLYGLDGRSGSVTVLKVASPRDRMPDAIMSGIRRLLEQADAATGEVHRVSHGTTVVTNQLVEHRGAKVGVIATRGFRDVLEIGRMRRPSLYDLRQGKTPPLADRTLREEVVERTSASGVIQQPLDKATARAALRRLAATGAEAVAVCLLNSYANSSNEVAVGQICEELGLRYSLSSAVSPEYGEYERWSTCCVNCYVLPETAGYLAALETGLADLGISCALEVMQSSGGSIGARVASAFPVRLVESGPAAGVAAAARMAAGADLITLDMGGTSTDVSLVRAGSPAYRSDHLIEGLPVRVLGIDVRSIGAGGGSLVSVDRTGRLRVGPSSAGASPGPACYGQGGLHATVTDADLVLGYVDPDGFCGGRQPLYLERAFEALGRIAGQLKVSPEEVALGVVNVVAASMVGAVRAISTERGYDPRDFTLVAYGGAGPAHAGLVAQELEMTSVLIPVEPALFSARGLLMCDYRAELVRTMVSNLALVKLDALNAALFQLESAGREQLQASGAALDQLIVRRRLELCYEGQQHMVPIEVGNSPLTAQDVPQLKRRLDEDFLRIYGFLPEQRVPRLLRISVGVEAKAPYDMPVQSIEAGPAADEPAMLRPREMRRIIFDRPAAGGQLTPVYLRSRIVPGGYLEGPCVIEEDYCSTVVYPGQRACCDLAGNLRLILPQQAAGREG